MDILDRAEKCIAEMMAISGGGMKMWLLDSDTFAFFSTMYTLSEKLSQSTNLFELIDSPRDDARFLKCLVFVRPTQRNIQLLTIELHQPKYTQYYIYFSNFIDKNDITMIAKSDTQNLVRDIREVFCDGIPLCKHVFVQGQKMSYNMEKTLTRSGYLYAKQFILSVLLMLNKKPNTIYCNNNSDCEKLADDTITAVKSDVLFQTLPDDNTAILLFDRSQDCITPLLTQWSYAGMINEQIGINDNHIMLYEKQIPLSEINDHFYKKNALDDFRSAKKILEASCADAQDRNEFQNANTIFEKHRKIFNHLDKLLPTEQMDKIASIEQLILKSDADQYLCFSEIRNLFARPHVSLKSIARLVLLLTLRFEGTTSSLYVKRLIHLLRCRNKKINKANKSVLYFGGSSRRSNSLSCAMISNGAEERKIKYNLDINLQPSYLEQVVESIVQDKLRIDQNNCCSKSPVRANNIIVVLIGGASYEEIAYIYRYNERRQKTNLPSLILATSHVFDTEQFIRQT